MNQHLTITEDEHGNERFEWDWDKLANSIDHAVKTYEYSKLSKEELEAKGRVLGIELDRRKKLPKLVEQLVQFELLKGK